jgi:L-iditol 2-dehydrogenase
MMKGLVKYDSGPGNLELREIAEPKPLAHQVKIEVKAAGICGSDIHIWHSDIAIPVRPPVVIGHEFSGVVVEVGEGVTTCKVGDRVTSETAYSYCGKCHNCKTGRYNLCDERRTLGYWYNGAFAKYTVVPEDRIHILSKSVSFEEGAMMEPAACVTNALMDLINIQAGDVVLVSGPGAVGLIALQVAKAHGAFVIVSGTSVDAKRLEFAKKLGADIVVDVTKEDLLEIVKKNTLMGRGVDVVAECSGSGRATAAGIEAVRKQGHFVQIGLAGSPFELNFDRICYKEIKVTGSLGSVWTSWKNAIKLVESGKLNLKDLASHTFSLDDWQKGFEVFENKEGLKVLFKP